MDGTESGRHPSAGDGPGSRRHAPGVASRSRREGWARARAGSHAARRRGAHAQSRTSPGGAGDPGSWACCGGGGGWSARAAAPDWSGLGGCCSAQRPGPTGARSSMCRGSPAAAAAPLQQRQQQRPPWPSPARSSPASCKVRGCGGLRDSPSRSIPDQCVPPAVHPIPGASPNPLAACLPTPGSPLPLHPSSGYRCPRSILGCSPRLTLSGPSSSRASRPDLR